MKISEPLEHCADETLRERLAEAERAKKLLEDNPTLGLSAHCSYRLEGDEILTLETGFEPDFLLLELTQIIELIHLELLNRYES